jgi:hypothetical protein
VKYDAETERMYQQQRRRIQRELKMRGVSSRRAASVLEYSAEAVAGVIANRTKSQRCLDQLRGLIAGVDLERARDGERLLKD